MAVTGHEHSPARGGLGLAEAAAASPTASAFVSSTASVLIAPRSAQDRASEQMIDARNSYFEDAYSWVRP